VRLARELALGSYYQRVRVLRVSGRRLELEVTEVHPDMHALEDVRADEDGWLLVAFAAQLLLDRWPSAPQRTARWLMERRGGRSMQPEEFVVRAALLSCQPLPGDGQYQARIAVELTRDDYADEYAPGLTWDAAADCHLRGFHFG
jgi:hypothetical protein